MYNYTNHIHSLYLHKECLPHSVTLFLIVDGRNGDLQSTNGSRSQLHAERFATSSFDHQLVIVRQSALQKVKIIVQGNGDSSLPCMD